MNKIDLYNLEFDKKLHGIKHYSTHPEMLPYVGDNYNKSKLLIISESHYAPKSFKEECRPEDWYHNRTIELYKKMEGNTGTRNVINNYITGKGHRLFSNIEAALKRTDRNLALENIAWYNFYQRPAKHKKEFNNPAQEDIAVSLDVFEGVLEILDPNLVIFVSKNAFGCLQKGPGKKKDREWSEEMRAHQYKQFKNPIVVTTHPNSSWWNRKHGKNKETGRVRFERIIKMHY
jgi:hypothetical protein